VRVHLLLHPSLYVLLMGVWVGCWWRLFLSFFPSSSCVDDDDDIDDVFAGARNRIKISDQPSGGRVGDAAAAAAEDC
jgi:hypothetical protein